VLREHWGWSEPYNWITSDCGAVYNIDSYDNYASSDADAAAVALNAGCDLTCDYNSVYPLNLPTAIAANTTNEAAVDRSLSRLYSSLIQVGYFNTPAQYSSLGWADVGTVTAQQTAYQAASEGMVLLKNSGVLPLPKTVFNVAIIGPWANATTQMQGNYQGVAPYLISPYMGMSSKWSNVRYVYSTDIDGSSEDGFMDAIEAAQSADYIIYCGGIDTSIEAEGLDRPAINWILSNNWQRSQSL
jgi:beta-D-xylosidase 4